jgi:hypothetical protein
VPNPSTLLFCYLIGAALSAGVFLAFTIWDRRVNDTPWNSFTMSTRIPMLMVFWPIFLPMAFVFMVPPMVKSVFTSRSND